MCRGPSAAALALRTLAAVTLLIGESEGAKCERSTTNNCTADKDCVPTIGPTQCVDDQCICQEGFCWAKADNDAKEREQMRCRAQVGTCDILGGCTGNHGGPRGVDCIGGLCLCHSGYHADADGNCQFGWWPPKPKSTSTLTSLTSTFTSLTSTLTSTTATTTSATSSQAPSLMWANATGAPGNLQWLSPWWQQILQLSTMPAVMLPAYALALCSGLFVAAAVALQRRRRGRAVAVTSSSASVVASASGDCIDETCYEPLASAPLNSGGEGNIDSTRGSSALR